MTRKIYKPANNLKMLSITINLEKKFLHKEANNVLIVENDCPAEKKSWMATHLPCTDLLVRRILSELECTPCRGTCDTKTGAFCCSLFSISLGCVHFVTLPGLFFTSFWHSLSRFNHFGHYDVGSLLKILEIGHI